MKIRLANTWLADNGTEAASQLVYNGNQVIDEVAFFRAAARVYYARGNEGSTISFSVRRVHASILQAELFVLTHFASLPKSGLCTFVVGEGADTQNVYLADAVLEAVPQVDYVGLSTTTRYTIRGGLPNTDTPSGDTSGDESVIRRNTVNLASGAESVDVTFSSSLSSTPTVLVSLIVASGNPGVTVWVDKDSVTIDGFTARFGAPLPDATYQLSYLAIY